MIIFTFSCPLKPLLMPLTSIENLRVFPTNSTIICLIHSTFQASIILMMIQLICLLFRKIIKKIFVVCTISAFYSSFCKSPYSNFYNLINEVDEEEFNKLKTDACIICLYKNGIVNLVEFFRPKSTKKFRIFFRNFSFYQFSYQGFVLHS